MKVHKPAKFPIELTRGKAEDLYRLRFLRRSELDPPLRHSIRYNNFQMGRQLDLWYKDRAITIGSLNKEHDKLCQNHIRLKKEIRRIKKEEYVRNQNEIRKKLQAIRFRMIMMKVLRKFRENVDRQKRERQKIVGKKFDVANYVLSVPTQTDYPEYSEEFKRPIKDTKLSRVKAKSSDVLKRDSAIRSFQIGRNRTPETQTYNWSEKDRSEALNKRDVDVAPVFDDEDDVPISLLGRYPSSKGPRMETIQEEMEIDVEENTDRMLPRETEKKKKSQINRSKSNRDVFASNDAVPLLPEVKQNVTSKVTGSKEDRGTQTSPSCKERRKKKNLEDITDKTLIKKKLVVKLPSPIVSPTSVKTTKSSSSTFGHHGSDTEDCYPDSFSDTDEGFFFDSDTVEPSGDYSTELFESFSSDDSEEIGDRRGLTFTFDNYKQLQRKQENSSFSTILKHPEDVNISEFPVRAVFQKQNPFSLRFKERSFYVQSNADEGRVASARSDRRHMSEYKRETEKLEEIRDRRLADIRAKMTKEPSLSVNNKPSTNMAVFGKKADCRKISVAPPNTPQVLNKSGLNQRAQTNPKSFVKTENKKLSVDKLSTPVVERHKSKEPVYNDTVYQHERTKPIQLSPFTSPRAYTQDMSTMQSLYARDKLLKAERDNILNQNMKMQRFINTFEHLQECTFTDFQTRPTYTFNGSNTQSSPGPKKTLSGFMFAVNTKGSNEHSPTKTIAPPISVPPHRVLKNCRYLREYVSVADKDYTATFQERRTSWQRKSDNSASYYDNYVANVRLQL